MDVDFIFKIAGIGIIVAVLNQLLDRSGREDQGLMVSLAGLIVVLVMVRFALVAPARRTMVASPSTFWEERVLLVIA